MIRKLDKIVSSHIFKEEKLEWVATHLLNCQYPPKYIGNKSKFLLNISLYRDWFGSGYETWKTMFGEPNQYLKFNGREHAIYLLKFDGIEYVCCIDDIISAIGNSYLLRSTVYDAEETDNRIFRFADMLSKRIAEVEGNPLGPKTFFQKIKDYFK